MVDIDEREWAEVRAAADSYLCQKLHERYWYGLASHDVDMICSVFTDDARYGQATGAAEIRAAAQGYVDILANILENYHLVPVANITIEGDRGRGELRAAAFVRAAMPDGTEKVLGLGVGYLDDFVRTPDGWRISAMRGIECGFAGPHDTTWQFSADQIGNLLGDAVASR